MSIKEEIEKAKAVNWTNLVAKKAEEITVKKTSPIFGVVDDIQKRMRLNPEQCEFIARTMTECILLEAASLVSEEIKKGLYDEMLMPKENNL